MMVVDRESEFLNIVHHHPAIEPPFPEETRKKCPGILIAPTLCNRRSRYWSTLGCVTRQNIPQESPNLAGRNHHRPLPHVMYHACNGGADVESLSDKTAGDFTNTRLDCQIVHECRRRQPLNLHVSARTRLHRAPSNGTPSKSGLSLRHGQVVAATTAAGS